MASCKDCVYVDICDFSAGLDEPVCGHFKDCARFIELPCKVGDSYFEVVQRCTAKGWYDNPHRTGLSDCEFCDIGGVCDKEFRIEEGQFTTLLSVFLFMTTDNESKFLTEEEAKQALTEKLEEEKTQEDI